MTTLDDKLRDLFTTSGPDDAELQGDLRQVHTEVRRRSLRRRATYGLVAAAAVAAGAFLVIGRDTRDRVDTDLPPATQPETSTTAPGPSTTARTSTTLGTTTTASTSTSSSTPSSTAAPGPSIHDVDLFAATYVEACRGFEGIDQTVTLQGGEASFDDAPGFTYEVSLGPVSYVDADSDGDEDAVLFLWCNFNGGSFERSGDLRAYRLGSDGQIEEIGASHPFVAPREPMQATVAGVSATVDVNVFADGDPSCCPSSAVRERWTFDGDSFEKTNSTALPPPGSG
jgi:hypothetical protein